MKPVFLHDPNFVNEDKIRHGFFTRQGGVSTGIYESLNVGVGSDDDKKSVMENRRRICEVIKIPETHLVTVHQIHSNQSVFVSKPFGAERPQCDAIVTDQPNLALGVLTADCGPILFADDVAGVVGAAHAGWKGALAGIAEATIKMMEDKGATKKNIMARLGPTISQENYEVGNEFFEQFIRQNDENKKFFISAKRKEHFQFNLVGYIINKLENNGINAKPMNQCTYKEKEKFFSHRRTTHKQEIDYGRQISIIMINE